MNRQIVFLTVARYPDGDAPATRVLALAKTARDAGYAVMVIGNGFFNPADLSSDGRYYKDGIQYDSIRKNWGLADKLFRYFFLGVSFILAARASGISRQSVIIVSGGYQANLLLMLWAWVNKHILIVDSMEWYIRDQFAYAPFNLNYLRFLLGFYIFYPLSRSVIAISTLLEEHFRHKNCQTLHVPPTVDTQLIPCNLHLPDSHILKLIYAGSPGRKDYLHTVIEGISLLTADEQAQIDFNIYGIGPQQLQQYLEAAGSGALGSSLNHAVIAHGRVPRQTVLEALQASDFMVLLRPQLRYANAGFPSKVPESLAVGTPVMLNYTSDLSLYIRDGYEGLVVADCTAQEVADTLHRALALSREERDTMRHHARQCAEQHFDYRAYIEPFRTFLERV